MPTALDQNIAVIASTDVRRRAGLMVGLFAGTLLAGSFLLFLIEPMLAKMLLPKLGGTPAVWNTCMVFFQACLLAGYGYAHWISQRTRIGWQALIHIGVLCVPLVLLPIALPGGNPPADKNPIVWVLTVLALAVGLPFFALSTGAPLMQKWFAATRQRGSDDPYFLYAASNLGSMLALLAYPMIVEPRLRLNQQARMWSVGYGVWAGLTAVCALAAWRGESARGRGRDGARPSEIADPVSPPTIGQDLRWIVLAFVPSSYLLGVTTFMTSDIAAAPLLWIVPLALYLLTFILAFSGRQIISHRAMVFALPTAMLGAVIFLLARAAQPVSLIICLHLIAFFVAAMVCHGELARTRPSSDHLTRFYLMISAGGVLGGVFNALVAPVVFNRTLEYPIAMVLACALCPPRSFFRPAPAHKAPASEDRAKLLDILLPLALAVITWLSLRFLPLDAHTATIFAMLALPALLCISFVERRNRFAMGMGALLLVYVLAPTRDFQLLEIHRSFFGVHRVMSSSDGQFVELLHGTTLHGKQRVDPVTHRPIQPDVALTYYTAAGPVGQVLETVAPKRNRHLAMVGLGGGSVAAYARAGDQVTFYEIDPLVRSIADGSGYFTYLSAARQRGAEVRVVLGDARLTLTDALDHSLDVLVLDAFSGDAVPVHLLTREALEIYLRKLNSHGVLAIHISNLYLDLKPVLANLARDAGCAALCRDDLHERKGMQQQQGWSASQWMVIARAGSDLGPLIADPRWVAPAARPEARLWTDDYSNILSVFRWRYGGGN